MFGKAKTSNPRLPRYATSADFCRIFEKDMNRLYLLALLLTGAAAAAEKCFVQGLSDSKSSNPVFAEWAESWARRTIVQNAIRMVRPRPGDLITQEATVRDTTQAAEIAAILALPAFDRFAYVLSVLENYPLQECALLLDCSRNEVIKARMRALQEVVKAVELHNGTLASHSRNRVLHGGAALDSLSHLAATA